MSTKRHPIPITTLYTPTEAAEALGCSTWWLREQARQRRIPFTWIGGAYKFTVEQIQEIIRLGEQRPAETQEPSTTSPRRRRPATTAPSTRLTARPPARTRLRTTDTPTTL